MMFERVCPPYDFANNGGQIRDHALLTIGVAAGEFAHPTAVVRSRRLT